MCLAGHGRALPVLGCTQKGALSRWLRFLDTSTSSRGYVCANTISLRARASAARRAFPSAALPSSTCRVFKLPSRSYGIRRTRGAAHSAVLGLAHEHLGVSREAVGVSLGGEAGGQHIDRTAVPQHAGSALSWILETTQVTSTLSADVIK